MSGAGRSGNPVKNRAPAPVQISAEQIVREAADRRDDDVFQEPVLKIHDAEEYQSHLRDRRKHYEDNIRYRRDDIGNWVKYAKFEEDNKEYERARSVFERALEVDHRSSELWLRYTEMEMRNEFVNHARNVLDRAIQILPRVDFLWYKYVYMEEMIGAVDKARTVFERWMKWVPDDNAWVAYAKFEKRHAPSGNDPDRYQRVEAVLRRYVNTYPSITSFIKFAKFAEYELKNVALARTVYESAISELEPEEVKQARIFKQFASFEERQGEIERARVIYKHAISLLKLGSDLQSTLTQEELDDITETERQKRQELYDAYLTFEKKHGSRQHIEQIVWNKQRSAYKSKLDDNPYDYDTWFELIKLEEEYTRNLRETIQAQGNADGTSDDAQVQQAIAAVRDTYERAVANVPPTAHNKDDWRRYIYLWIYYAVYEELSNRDLRRASQIYDTCLNQVVPHKQFSFSKIWILAAQVLVRQKQLPKARKLFGRAIGLCGKERIYQEYIALELALGEIDRCRTLYTKYLKAMPYNCVAWCKYAQLEQSVGETERARAIYELGVSQSTLDRPELLWKSYIDFEIDEGEHNNVRALYERLLEKTGHVKVWISYAQFEGTTAMPAENKESGSAGGIVKAREIFQKAYEQLQRDKLNEERVLLLDAWRVLEKSQGDPEHVQLVERKMPRRIKRKRMRHDDATGEEMGWEEYFDYQFPDDVQDDTKASNFKILEMAAQWKAQQQAKNANKDDSDDDDDDDDDDDSDDD